MRIEGDVRAAPSRSSRAALWVVAVVVVAAGVVFAPQRLAAAALLSGLYMTGLALGAMFLIAVHDVSGGAWLGGIRGVARRLSSLIHPGIFLVLAAVIGGGRVLYPWISEPAGAHFAGFKAIWLTPGFFFARSLAYAAVWLIFFRLLALREARRETNRKGMAAAFIVVFAVTVWLSSVDWIMSLEPHWASTIFGVYHFSGLFAAAIAAVCLMAIRFRRAGGVLKEEQLHDLGKLLFAFSTFWMYIWFSQFMLVWYGNIPEEALYYTQRLTGVWRMLFIANVFLGWVIPFAVLLPRAAKVNEKVLGRVAVTVLAGHWLDLYLGIYPPIFGTAPAMGGWEALVLLASAGVTVAMLLPMRREAVPVPLSSS